MIKYVLFILPLLILLACKKKDDVVVNPSSAQVDSFTVTIQNIFSGAAFFDVGTFDSIPSGGSVSFTVRAPYGSNLSFVTKLSETNDLFYCPNVTGIPLYFNSAPLQGVQEANKSVLLWDSGLKKNEDLTGATPDSLQTVRLLGTKKDIFIYPDITTTMSVQIQWVEDMVFKVTITNLGAYVILDKRKPVTLSAGVWVVHTTDHPFFGNEANQPLKDFILIGDTGTLREDRRSQRLSNDSSGIPSGVWAVHNAASKPFFTKGALYSTYNNGLDNLVLHNNSQNLADTLESAIGVRYSGTFPAIPKWNRDSIKDPVSTSFVITAHRGDHFSFVTKMSNASDEFLSFSDAGINLWDNTTGQMIDGDATPGINIFDLGLQQNKFDTTTDTTDISPKGIAPVTNSRITWPAPYTFIRVKIQPTKNK